jgi:predicted ABC-type ATPase
VFVNADEIAKQRWPDDPLSHAYDAARVASETRFRLIELGRSFIAETVFSHPSELNIVQAARAADYTVVVHVLLVPADLVVERVSRRGRVGGQDVPEEVATAAAQSDTATVYDNSRREGPRIVARISGGIAVGSSSWPSWTPESLRSHWPD